MWHCISTVPLIASPLCKAKAVKALKKKLAPLVEIKRAAKCAPAKGDKARATVGSAAEARDVLEKQPVLTRTPSMATSTIRAVLRDFPDGIDEGELARRV